MTRGAVPQDARRALPSVTSVLDEPGVGELLRRHPRPLVVAAVRDALKAARRAHSSPDLREIAESVAKAVESALQPPLRSIINATGTILHTNLGRAPLADVAIRAVADTAGGYSNLEYDVTSGTRGSRYSHCVDILRELTGADDAIVVNNCASALLLALSAVARERDVIVSRGELVEIGGSFRVPDIMERSGARLVEVGTTNRTHLEDYRSAISARTGAIAKVHRSNFAQSGFVADVSVQQLVPVAAEHDLPVVHDLGSGLLVSLAEFGLTGEPTAGEALAAGASLVLMSGDKLLGGPQAGIAAGRTHIISRMRQDPFARAMRVDKMTIAALWATLALYREPRRAFREIPALAMITAPAEEVRARAERLAARVRAEGTAAEIVETSAAVGAGAFPTAGIPSWAVAFEGAVALERKLRAGTPPVVGRIESGRLLLDLRSVRAGSDETLADAVCAAL